MADNEIKVGETYNLRVKVLSVDTEDAGTGVATIPVDGNGKELDDEWAYYGLDIASAFSPITPENGIKNTEPAPKYDPCRLFRKGDKVRLVPYRGRAPIMFGSNVFSIGRIFTVEEDENKEYYVMLNGTSHRQLCQACFLELITPVEEREPYFVSNDDYEYCVFDQRTKMTVCRFDISHPHPKEAAQAECARLNAEHRKEKQK